MLTESRVGLLAMAAAGALLLAGRAAAQAHGQTFPSVDLATAITDKRGVQVPGDLSFVDEAGQPVRLSDYLQGERPVILNLGYYLCPSLCGAVWNGLIDALQELPLEIGVDFEIVTISIDPTETPELARKKKDSCLAEYTAPGAEKAWHFLTGEEREIRALADTVGFGYQWNEHGERYAHGGGLWFLSPTGVLSQVVQGYVYPSRTVRLALVEASEGKIGTTWDRILLNCYGFDPTTNEYNLAVWAVIRIGGGLTVLGIAVMIFLLWRRERRRVAMATP